MEASLTKIDVESAVCSKFDLFCSASKKYFSDADFLFALKSFSADVENYQTDAKISLEVTCRGKKLLLTANVPGIFYDSNKYTVDLFSQDPNFESAVRYYGDIIGFIILKKKNLEKISFRLISEVGGGTFFAPYEKTKAELENTFADFSEYVSCLFPLLGKGCSGIKFPYKNLRDGQKTLIKAVWNAIKSKSSLYAMAPTGIGKTLAVLYPAMKALESGKAEKIIYIAPKATQKKQVENSVMLLQGENVKTLTLTLDAKMKLCPKKLEECSSFLCEYERDFNESMQEAVHFLSDRKFIGAGDVIEAGEKFKVCPFEIALRMIRFADIVICDYNYVFDPKVGLKSLKDKKHILLCDESHNLPDRIRESFSESISPKDFDVFFKSNSFFFSKITPHLGDIVSDFELNSFDYSQKKACFSKLCDTGLAEKCETLMKKISETEALFSEISENEYKAVRDLKMKLRKFILISKMFDENFRTLNYENGGKKLYPASVQKIVSDVKNSFLSTVFFSATLSPEDYYSAVLAKDDADTYLTLPSPFDRENLFVGICDVDVSFSNRFLSAKKLCSIIKAAISSKKGNFMVFLPSFEYLDFLVMEFKKTDFENTVIFQKRNMSFSEREKFLSEFSAKRHNSLVAFAVLGGVFGEGIDLVGDLLEGEIIVGTGFPPPSLEKEAESNFFNEKEMNGTALAYTLQGMGKVFQAAGRVIRSDTDRGFVILCDTRYLAEDMRETFPDLWDGGTVIESEHDLIKRLESFWS